MNGWIGRLSLTGALAQLRGRAAKRMVDRGEEHHLLSRRPRGSGRQNAVISGITQTITWRLALGQHRTHSFLEITGGGATALSASQSPKNRSVPASPGRFARRAVAEWYHCMFKGLKAQKGPPTR